MSVADMPDRPAFQSMEPGFDEIQTAPTSRLAIIACVLGTLSLLTILSSTLLPLAVIAIACGAVAIWQASRDGSVSGIRLAQVGLALAVFGSAWNIASTRTRNAYIFEAATPHAQAYLALVSRGEIYQAYELTKTENARQISGTDLEAYYNNLKDEISKDQAMSYIKSDYVKEISSRGKDAQWEFVRGEVASHANSMRVKMIMRDATQPSKKRVAVSLARDYSPSENSPNTYTWHVSETTIVKE